jgi:hypothetical protein
VDLVADVVLNVRANAIRSTAVLAMTAAALGVLFYLEVHRADELIEYQRDYVRRGGYLALISSDAGIPADRCEALGREEWVVAAGAAAPAGHASLASVPGVSFAHYRVTQGLLSVWFPGVVSRAEPGVESVYAGETLAREMGLVPGGRAAIEGGPNAAVASVVPLRDRVAPADRSIIEVVPAIGTMSQCWVEFAPRAFRIGLETAPALLATGDQPVTVSQHTISGQFTRSPQEELTTRPERRAWVAAGLIVILLTAITTWFRRSEIALYAALGTDRVRLVVANGLEAWALTLGGVVSGVLWALALERLGGHTVTLDSFVLAMRSTGSAALLIMAVAPLAPLLVRGDIAAALKDR